MIEDHILLDQQLEATEAHLQLIAQGVMSHQWNTERDTTTVRALLMEFNKSENPVHDRTVLGE